MTTNAFPFMIYLPLIKLYLWAIIVQSQTGFNSGVWFRCHMFFYLPTLTWTDIHMQNSQKGYKAKHTFKGHSHPKSHKKLRKNERTVHTLSNCVCTNSSKPTNLRNCFGIVILRPTAGLQLQILQNFNPHIQFRCSVIHSK